ASGQVVDRLGVRWISTGSGFRKRRYEAPITSSTATIAPSQRITRTPPAAARPSAAFGAGLLAAGLALERLGQRDARRAHPQAFQVVEFPHRHVEDVDDDVAEVHQHPLRMRQSLD